MTAGPGFGRRGYDHGRLRATDTDRERAVDVLKAAFAEGRLTKDEYDERVSGVYASRTYAELAALTSDLPTGPFGSSALARSRPAYLPTVRQPPNGLAVASFACGIAGFFTAFLTAVPAVVCGYIARRQIRETGEPGAGLARVGVILGWIGVLLWTIGIAIVVGAAVVGGPHLFG